MCLWGALQVDLEHAAATEEERELAADLVGLLTPVIKGYGTDKGYDIATNAQQVYGGHGYIAEWGMEQYVRDARISMIYEGTNGIQAMDLVGRKLAQNGGRAVQLLFRVVGEEVAAAKQIQATADFAARLEKANGELQAATMWFLQNGMTNPEQCRRGRAQLYASDGDRRGRADVAAHGGGGGAAEGGGRGRRRVPRRQAGRPRAISPSGSCPMPARCAARSRAGRRR